MRKQGIDVRPGFEVTKLYKDENGIHLTSKHGVTIGGFDTVIWAVGRRPNTADLNLEAAGVETHRGGFVPVDDFENTNVEGIYAIGDIHGHLDKLRAAHERVAADRAACGDTANCERHRRAFDRP